MRKPLHIMHMLLSLETGGCENGVVNLINRMNPELFKVSVCCTEKIGELAERIDKSRRHVFLLNKKGRTKPKDILKFVNFFRKQCVDIIHTHGWGTLFLGVSSAKLGRIPVIIHGEHGILYDENIRRICAQRLLFNLTDCNITVSQDLASRISKIFGVPKNRFFPIINGVDLSIFNKIADSRRSDLRNQYGIKSDNCLIGSVGRLVDVKRYDLMVEAAIEICKRELPAQFMIVGDGPLKAKLQKMINDNGLQQNFFLVGRKDNVSDYLQAMDVFALPSTFEGISNTMLEAMSCGLPIVATNVGGTPEVVDNGSTGFLWETGDSDEFIVLLLKMISDDKLRKQIGSNSREKAKKKFSIDRMVSEYENIYIKVAQERGILE